MKKKCAVIYRRDNDLERKTTFDQIRENLEKIHTSRPHEQVSHSEIKSQGVKDFTRYIDLDEKEVFSFKKIQGVRVYEEQGLLWIEPV